MKLFNFIRALIEPFRHRATCPQDHKKIVHEFARNLERKMCAPTQVPRPGPTPKITRQQSLRSKHA
jgi:hypothetical protein